MTEEIRARIELISKSETPIGYKKTKIGAIPDDWDMKLLEDISQPLNEKAGNQKLETLSISAGIGFVNQAEKFGKELSGAQYVNYTVLNKGDFSYNKGNSKKYPQGCIYRLTERETAAVPNVFNSFRIEGQSEEYYGQLFVHGILNHQLFRCINSGVRNDGLLNLYDRDFYSCELPMPPLPEQQKIAEILTTCDKMIALKKELIAEKEKLKKSCLSKMFPKNGNNVPEIRFPGFTDAWEQRKLGETVLIERGGSPRPIEEYITTDTDGLNWVKIGDAPTQGSYITKTSEKIKPSGLCKTRQVEPGDLILSNSMSFGKPYIMAINGCIHDGWLLIRNTQNVFDLKFLCCLLGTEQMLIQYRASAAGSTVNNLNKELVSNTTVKYPTLPEQVQLGTFFSNLDTLITLHQRKLEETERYKKALMQLLLTGIIRVS